MMDEIKTRTMAVVYILMTSTFALTYAFNMDKDGYTSLLLHRSKRSAESCADKYREVTTEHTACLPPSSRLISKGVSEEDKRLIVDMHNIVRREVDPQATNMQLMSYDEDIAFTAQRWAENCVWGHDKGYKRYSFGRFNVGQNLAMGSHMKWQGAINMWADEKKDFTFGGSNNLMAVGHYTQMVWATSVKVGCGYAFCENEREGALPFHYYACNYGPGGNFNINKPYTVGSTCADCPTACTNGLCDCKGKVCLNGGTMDFDTCTCKCKKNLKFFLQPDCALNCTGIKEPWYCETSFQGKCEVFSNVPQECPSMCGWCPYSARGYESIYGAASVSSASLTSFIITLFTCWYSTGHY